MARSLQAAILVTFISLGTPSSLRTAFADSPPEDGLAGQSDTCDKNVQMLRSEIDRIVLWSNIFTLSGALVAAIGSTLAAFLTNGLQRKVGAVIGALGAVICVLPKTLADKEMIHSKMAAADRHRVVAAKVRSQLPFAASGQSTSEAKKYAAARLADCAAFDPPNTVPDFPAFGAGVTFRSQPARCPAEQEELARFQHLFDVYGVG